MADIDKKDVVIELLKNENAGLYLAYGEIGKRLRLEEAKTKELKKKLKEQEKQKNEELKRD